MALLIVDDESWVRNTIKHLLLENSNFRDLNIIEATDGASALEIIQNDLADMMITDMNMPGMDGKRLLEIIEKDYKQFPVIVLSGYDDFAYTKQAIRAKVVEYLLKPVNEIELYQAIERAMQYSKDKEEQINYQLFTIQHPEINELIQPLHEELYDAIKEINIEQFKKTMKKFQKSIDLPMRVDKSFILHTHQKFLMMIEEIMQEYQLTIEDINMKLKKLKIHPGITFEQMISHQITIGLAFISTLEKQKRNKMRINLDEIKEFIENYFVKYDMSLDYVAKIFFVSKEYLTTVFKKQYGFNITEYIIMLRMEKAKELVQKTNLQYKNIAEKVGYEDVTYFYRVFKKYYHITPGEMRKNYTNTTPKS